jgi:hypothetical protein
MCHLQLCVKDKEGTPVLAGQLLWSNACEVVVEAVCAVSLSLLRNTVNR